MSWLPPSHLGSEPAAGSCRGGLWCGPHPQHADQGGLALGAATGCFPAIRAARQPATAGQVWPDLAQQCVAQHSNVWGNLPEYPPHPCCFAALLQASLVFIDTEGFYSTGKSDAYDDRIFALSTLISSVLVYNLPETVRESDVEKLSFSVELADALFSSSQVGSWGGALAACLLCCCCCCCNTHQSDWEACM